MKIEGNQKELDAMVEFHKGNRVEEMCIRDRNTGAYSRILGKS